MSTTLSAEFLTPPKAAKYLGVEHNAILYWIHSGELCAINLSRGNARPRYKIRVSDLEAFLRRRETKPAPKMVRRKRYVEQDDEMY